VTIGTEGKPDAAIDRSPDESLVSAVAIRDLERDTGHRQSADGALFPLLRPELLQRKAPERERQKSRMR
jgi:hypothetical protein